MAWKRDMTAYSPSSRTESGAIASDVGAPLRSYLPDAARRFTAQEPLLLHAEASKPNTILPSHLADLEILEIPRHESSIESATYSLDHVIGVPRASFLQKNVENRTP